MAHQLALQQGYLAGREIKNADPRPELSFAIGPANIELSFGRSTLERTLEMGGLLDEIGTTLLERGLNSRLYPRGTLCDMAGQMIALLQGLNGCFHRPHSERPSPKSAAFSEPPIRTRD
jgi:hypothetical protein